MGFKIVRVTGDLLSDMFGTGYQMPTANGRGVRVTKGLPAGATLAGCDFEFTTNTALLMFHHPDWPEQDRAGPLPTLDVLCESFTPPASAGFAEEITSDGQSVRLEAPTLEDLNRLVRDRQASMCMMSKPLSEEELAEIKRVLGTARGTRMMVVDSDPTPTFVQG